MSEILTLKKFDTFTTCKCGSLQGNEIFGETVNAVFGMADERHRDSSVNATKIFDKEGHPCY